MLALFIGFALGSGSETAMAAIRKGQRAHSVPARLQLVTKQIGPQQPPSKDKETCTICLEEIDKNDQQGLVTTPCKHTFHTNCIFEWFRKSPKLACPKCDQSCVKLGHKHGVEEEHIVPLEPEEAVAQIRAIVEHAVQALREVDALQHEVFTFHILGVKIKNKKLIQILKKSKDVCTLAGFILISIIAADIFLNLYNYHTDPKLIRRV